MKIKLDRTKEHFRRGTRRVTTTNALTRLVKWQGMDTGEQIIPDGYRAIACNGSYNQVIFELEPGVRWVSWGRRSYKLSFPYLVFCACGSGSPVYLFFRNEPLRSLDDALYEPALPNCLLAEYAKCYWVCGTISANSLEVMAKRFRSDFFATGFNGDGYDSSGLCHYVGSGPFPDVRKITTPTSWEDNTRKDPSFILKMEWIKTKHTPRSLLEYERNKRKLILPATWQTK
jgi:hypothetical protein